MLLRCARRLPPAVAFSQWVSSRPDLKAALEAIHVNPGAALAPLPLPKPPVVLEVRRHTAGPTPHCPHD